MLDKVHHTFQGFGQDENSLFKCVKVVLDVNLAIEASGSLILAKLFHFVVSHLSHLTEDLREAESDIKGLLIGAGVPSLYRQIASFELSALAGVVQETFVLAMIDMEVL